MKYMILIIVLFILMLLFPVYLGIYGYFKNQDSVLFVRQNRKRDPRYFSKSFDERLLSELDSSDKNSVKLSRKEKICSFDELKEEDMPEVFNDIVVVREKEFVPRENSRFAREIYCFKRAHVTKGCRLRAIRARGDMIIGEDVILERWGDSDGTIAVYDNCDAGISLTAGKAISLGINCKFRRIYAPAIYSGAYPGINIYQEMQRDVKGFKAAVGRNIEKRVHVSGIDTENGKHVDKSFISTDKVIIDENVVVTGNVRTRKGIYVSAGAVVKGNIFSEKDIYISDNCVVLGSIFTQGSIFVEGDFVLGEAGEINSMVARGRIVLGKNCTIYGYMANEGGGIVCPYHKWDESKEMPQKADEKYFIAPEGICQE